MVAIPDPAVRFGIAVAVAVLWVTKGYLLSIYRGERRFKVGYATKTLLLGVVAGALGFVTGGDLALAAAIAVPFVDDIWSRFASTWNKLEDLPTVERFEAVANQLIDEYGDDAAEKMDDTRRRLTDKPPTDSSMGKLGGAAVSAGEAVDGFGDVMEDKAAGRVEEGRAETNHGNSMANTDAERWFPELTSVSGVSERKAERLWNHEYRSLDDLHDATQQDLAAVEGIGNALAARIKADVGGLVADDGAFESAPEAVARKVNTTPVSYDGYQKLRAVAGYLPSVDGNASRSAIAASLKGHDAPHAVLDAFATVEARERGEEQFESGGESA